MAKTKASYLSPKIITRSHFDIFINLEYSIRDFDIKLSIEKLSNLLMS